MPCEEREPISDLVAATGPGGCDVVKHLLGLIDDLGVGTFLSDLAKHGGSAAVVAVLEQCKGSVVGVGPEVTLDDEAQLFDLVLQLDLEEGVRCLPVEPFEEEGFAPGTYFGAVLVDFTPGVNVPYDTNGDGVQDTDAEFRAFLGANPEIGLSDSEMQPLIRDDDGDGDLLDHFLGKPTPDWSGSWGANVTLWQNLQINTVFEYKTGNYSVTNLTDAFRQANPSIGRNIKQSADVESTLLNPATVTDIDARFDAAMQWATELKALAPLSGLNTIENARFLRFRELSFAYRVPADFSSRFGLENMTISLTGRNLIKWDGYSGIDQEMNAISRCGGSGAATRDCNFLDGVDAFGLPLPRRYTFAIQFGL